MKSHKLSVTTLGAKLGGRAELRRALADELTAAKRKTFCQRLCKTGLFSEAECQRLQTALEISRIGVEQYTSWASIERLTGSEQPNQPVHAMRLANGGTLDEPIAALMDADEVEVLCLNCCYESVFNALAMLFKNQERRLFMRHYIHFDAIENNAASFVTCASPILLDKRYLPYSIQCAGANACQPLGGNLLLFRAQKGGHALERFFLVRDEQLGYELTSAAQAGLFAFYTQIVAELTPAPAPLKELQAEKTDYSAFVMSLIRRELNRSTYMLTSNFCFHQTPTQIALSAFRDKAAFPPQVMRQLEKQIIPMHEQRFQNLYHKRKQSYHVMTLSGCRDFLETGKTSDHFIGFRAFTPKERFSIFAAMLQAAAQNACLTPLVLKQDRLNSQYAMICFDKLGVAISSMHADYDLEGGYDCIFLTIPEFTRQFTAYFLHRLVAEKCYPRAESLRLLTQLYEQAAVRFAEAGLL
ncbi:MAG: hypothetical protein MR842_00665 [Clostridiales bacterium]|nr:hypothetical protein [Clostridiales bacterium]MDY4008747.1 hypothetical protein [Candidatus Limiplasma sp.]